MTDLKRAFQTAENGGRLDDDEALTLFHSADLLTLGRLAQQQRMTRHPESVVTYVVDRNINYTNVCQSGCLFCAFYRSKNHPDAYVISKASLARKITETLELGGTQILLQGGMHPDLDLDYYLELLRFMKGEFGIHIHGFSPPEIAYLAEKSNSNIKELIQRLQGAGLDTIPGGGAEILVDEIRSRISPNKCRADTWLAVMRTAHALGMKTTATMMFGHVEKPEHIVAHLMKIRALQDETNGFTAFIPWTFQPGNTQLDVQEATAADYLKVLALSRLVLDNVPNIQASWVTQGAKIAQVALSFGANDLGSTMIEENVVAAAGVNFRLPLTEMQRLIADAGFEPRQRDCYYRPVPRESGPGAAHA
jgi:cyclic dehypoxanthinyl futalosine synthase